MMLRLSKIIATQSLKSTLSVVTLITFYSLFCITQIKANNTDSVKIVSVSKCKFGETVPVLVVFIKEDEVYNNSFTGKYDLIASGNSLSVDTIYAKYGAGSILTSVLSNSNFVISLLGFNGEKQVTVEADIPQIVLSGNISENTLLTNDFDYLVEEDVIINENINLSIESGTRIFFDEDVNVFVNGTLNVNGTESEPVLFAAVDQSKAWGGINIVNSNADDTSKINHVFIIGGGGDIDLVFGHSTSQAVIKCENANAIFSNCYLMDNEGKCFGSSRSNVKILDSYLTRSDTGGEFINSIVFVKDVYVVDIPDGDHLINDDDNDGFYFNSVHPSGIGSVVDSCVFVTGEDDAIDHNGAILEVRNCLVDDFHHEGIAASNSNSVYVFNSLFKNCDQGIEAGYGSPNVSVEHCVVIDNGTGIRFGDSYNWGCSGKINIINSIVYNNTDNFRNYDLLTGGPISDAIAVSYCITNDTDYDNYPFCITGIPVFEPNYFLANNSPGKGMASTGLDLGLFNPLSNIDANACGSSCFNIYPNPGTDIVNISHFANNAALFDIKMFNITGAQVASWQYKSQTVGNIVFELNIESLSSGLYFVNLYADDVYCVTLKMIVE